MPYVVFSHGLDNKPAQDHLWQLWKRKLAQDDGLDIDTCGVASTLNYWADVLYASPDTNLAAYESAAGEIDGLNDETSLQALPFKDDERIRRLAVALEVDPDAIEESQPTQMELEAVRLERVPVPAWLRKRIMAKFVRDAHHYFFNMEFSPRQGATFHVRDELRRRFITCLEEGASGSGPLVVVAHSMGTIIAYDCLMHVPACPRVDGLMTIGSPLGLDEVQDFFPAWQRRDGFPAATLRGPWVNVFDPLDVVCGADPHLANDYMRDGQQVIEDIRQDNWGSWRHSISKYLQGAPLRRRLGEMLGVSR